MVKCGRVEGVGLWPQLPYRICGCVNLRNNFSFRKLLYNENGINLIFRENLNAAKFWANFFFAVTLVYILRLNENHEWREIGKISLAAPHPLPCPHPSPPFPSPQKICEIKKRVGTALNRGDNSTFIVHLTYQKFVLHIFKTFPINRSIIFKFFKRAKNRYNEASKVQKKYFSLREKSSIHSAAHSLNTDSSSELYGWENMYK